MYPIRVVVIDDSAFMRKMIADILISDHRIHVVATARNGQDGLKKIKIHDPDVVTLDVEMPVMDGITALQKIMATNPLPVVMLSSVTKEGTAKTMQAMANGAVDFIAKPSGAISLDINNIKQEMITKVLIASQAKLTQTRIFKNVQAPSVTQSLPQIHAKTIVTIGTSTGGPKALQQVLTDLPRDFPSAILIVQHMPAGFTKSLANRLDSLASIHVKEASHGEIIQNGSAYIAPGNYHMKIQPVGTAHTIELTQEDHRNGHRPAVDMLFESIATIKKVNKIAVVLTGMGSDGSNGMKCIRERDGQAVMIAEAEETSVVYGMPKAAVMTDCVNHIVPLPQVGETITNLIK